MESTITGLSSSQYWQQEASYLPSNIDLLAFCQLRWDFVWQRPQHLMTRWAKERRVFFVEEPVLDAEKTYLRMYDSNSVTVAVPHIRKDSRSVNREVELLIDQFVQLKKIDSFVSWYWTPRALAYTRHLEPLMVVFDCMDELAHFAHAPKDLQKLEKELISRADLMFTGGQSLYEAKRDQHTNIYPFPSSIDNAHFAKARNSKVEPADQAAIAHPRIGYFGVIDERMDLQLLGAISQQRPDWNFVLIGPVLKISPQLLPRAANLHYLGQKAYADLPDYLASWDVAMMPFALNEATRHISPTKTPEYLAAGKPVVSTGIRDVVRPYGDLGLVHIAHNTGMFVRAIELALQQRSDVIWSKKVDSFLKGTSWDSTWARMNQRISETYHKIRSKNAVLKVLPEVPSSRLEAREDV